MKNSIAGMNEINWPRWIRCVDSIGGSPIRLWSRKISLFGGAVIVFRPVFYETIGNYGLYLPMMRLSLPLFLFFLFASSSCVILKHWVDTPYPPWNYVIANLIWFYCDFIHFFSNQIKIFPFLIFNEKIKSQPFLWFDFLFKS